MTEYRWLKVEHTSPGDVVAYGHYAGEKYKLQIREWPRGYSPNPDGSMPTIGGRHPELSDPFYVEPVWRDIPIAPTQEQTR